MAIFLKYEDGCTRLHTKFTNVCYTVGGMGLTQSALSGRFGGITSLQKHVFSDACGEAAAGIRKENLGEAGCSLGVSPNPATV